MSTYVVTGAAGFIGFHVATLLIDSGHSVIGIDILDPIYDVKLKEWRLARLCERPEFTYLRGDICRSEDIQALSDAVRESQSSSGEPVAGIVNLAARAGVRQSIEDPASYFHVNVIGVINMLEMARNTGIRKFVQASSSSVYGRTNEKIFSENLDTDRPLSPYAASKKASELVCHSYSHLYDIDVAVLRFFTVFGPAGRPDMSVFRFIKWTAEGTPLRVNGDGEQSRDFTYVDDIARGAVAALKTEGYEVINLGGGRPTSINAIISQIEDELDVTAEIDRRPSDPLDVPTTWADISKARTILDWEPRVTTGEGIAGAVAWYRENSDLVRDMSTETRGVSGP